MQLDGSGQLERGQRVAGILAADLPQHFAVRFERGGSGVAARLRARWQVRNRQRLPRRLPPAGRRFPARGRRSSHVWCGGPPSIAAITSSARRATGQVQAARYNSRHSAPHGIALSGQHMQNAVAGPGTTVR